ncbi:MarR family winged helix-turn-helix transcriptional regulator [Aurantimonas endophytica]|uniref:MarR family winged helix-turn-helix transcriptional regulator n=2 Tax=Aurantimonas endophytica TaxID=1522175 RepID=UPI00338DCC74
MVNSKMPTEAVATNGMDAAEAALVPKLLSIAKSIRAMMGLRLADLGMHAGQDELLLALVPEGTVSGSRLADTLAVRPSTVSKMLDRLVTAGLVERAEDPRDARRTVVRLTSSGVDMQGRLREVWQEVENELQDVPDRSVVTHSLQELQRVLSAKLRRLR